MKSLKLSEYFKIMKPQYIYLKLTPDTSIRNYNSTNIAKVIANLYKLGTKRIKAEEKKWVFPTKFTIEAPMKCSYMIDIYKTEVNFYLIIPQQLESIMREKIQSIWQRVSVEKVEGIKHFTQHALKYQLIYSKEDPLSLKVNHASNDPLNSILNVIDVMEDKDRVGLFYNFIPCSQRGWKKEYNNTIHSIKNKMPVNREKVSAEYAINLVINYTFELLDYAIQLFADILGSTKKETESLTFLELAAETFNNNQSLSTATIKKKDAMVIDTQILVLSESDDNLRKNNNALAVCQSFRNIEEDNELIYKKIKNKKKNTFYVTDFRIAGSEANRVSIDECQNFIQLPGRELLEQHKCIKKIDTLESEVPKQLQQGTKLIGISEYKGNNQKAHLTTDKDYKNLAVVVVGPTRSGKTSFLGNLARNCIDAGECVILPDYIENCQLAEDIKKCIPKDKVLEINLSDYHNLPSFSYSEANSDNKDPLYIYDNLKKQANLLAYLINAVNLDNKELAPRMDRYLKAAAHIVYSQNGPTGDIFMVLEDHIKREEYIKNIPNNLKEYLYESIEFLEQLDEWSKATKDKPAEKVGTHMSYISGILDRFYILKGNTAMELMVNKSTNNVVNLVNEIEKNQLIIIKMPEDIFPTEQERDIIVTYWITKLYLAGQIRAKKIPDRYIRKTVNVITDEIAQLENAERFIGSRLDKTAKFGVKFILSTMYINQLRIRDKLRNANTSYILIAGSDKVNYTELKEELSQFGYTLEDLMNLKRFESLNYIKYEKGYSAFITKLPKPIA